MSEITRKERTNGMADITIKERTNVVTDMMERATVTKNSMERAVIIYFIKEKYITCRRNVRHYGTL